MLGRLYHIDFGKFSDEISDTCIGQISDDFLNLASPLTSGIEGNVSGTTQKPATRRPSSI